MRTIRFFGILGFVFLLSCSGNEEDIQPNILWLTFEDTSPMFIGCYGNEAARTPVMDELAAEGIRFTSAFSTGTVCSPSRFALITGCRTTRYGTGHHRSYYDVPEEVEGFPMYLRQAGYYTSNNSKTDYNTSKHRHIIDTAWDESSGKAGWWKREPGQPFFAVFNSFHSHQSRVMTNPYWKYEEQVLQHLDSVDVIEAEDIPVPPIFRDSKEVRKELSRVYNGIQLTDHHFGEILDRLESEGLKDSTIIFCFSDHGEGIPWGKTYPRAMGYRVPFIIYFPDMYKHLSPWGTNVVTSDVIDFVDLPATVLSLAGIEVPEYMEGRALLGKDRQKAKQYTVGGLDRSGENTTLCRSISDGEYVYNRNFMPFQGEKRWQKYFDYSGISCTMRKDLEEGVLNEVQSMLFKKGRYETMYNLSDDPWETKSLTADGSVLRGASSPRAQQEKKNELKEALKFDLIAKRDAHFIPEYEYHLKEESPYELSRDEVFFPAKEVIELAFLIGEEGALEDLLGGLKHDNDILRYWAAIGVYSYVCMYGSFDELAGIEGDSYGPADVFLQAARFVGLEDSESGNSLLGYLEGKNPDLQLLSAQLFLAMDDLDARLVKKILYACWESEFSSVTETGELFEYKYNGVPLEYKHFW